MAALLKDKPDRPLQHLSELIVANATWTARDLLIHLEPFSLLPSEFWLGLEPWRLCSQFSCAVQLVR
jgi:hypothetical protein